MTAQAPCESKYILWMDLLRGLAVFCVILIHVSADVLMNGDSFPKSWWFTANLYDALVRGTVPAFIMISGALLLPMRENYRYFFSKRLQRIAVPFLFWVVFYILWTKYFHVQAIGMTDAFNRMLRSGGAYYHLWFLYTLVGLYLLTPLLRILAAHASGRDILYFLALWFIFGSVMPFAQKGWHLFGHADLKFGISIDFTEGYIGYFVLGYFLRKYVPKRCFPFLLAVWVTSFFACVYGTFFLYHRFHVVQNLFYENLSPNVVLYVTAYFAMLKLAGPRLEKDTPIPIKKIIGTLAKTSFGIYLIHPVFIDLLTKGTFGFKLTGAMQHPLWMIPFAAGVIYVFSLGAVLMIQKIPYLRRIT